MLLVDNALRYTECVSQGFAYSQGHEGTLFDYLVKHPERATKFANGMSAINAGPGYRLDHIINDPIWKTLGNASIVDLGGSTGEAMTMLLMQFPLITAVVQDLASPMNGYLEPPPEIQNRISFMTHDFFKVQPVKNADVYFFRLVLHNWSDEDCFRILRALVPALKPGAKIIAVEWCMSEIHSASIAEERRLRYTLLSPLNDTVYDRG